MSSPPLPPSAQTSSEVQQVVTKGVVCLGVKWPGREADHQPLCNVEFKDVWSHTSTPRHSYKMYLLKHTDISISSFRFTHACKTQTHL